MKIAVFGGTGFIGYHFIRQMLGHRDVSLVVYSSSPKSLVNVSRHEVPIRLYTARNMALTCVEDGIDFIVTFAHPFGDRDGLSPRQQTDCFTEYVARQKGRSPQLRLINVSTMSVYEPFSSVVQHDEDQLLDPPRSDRYASDKVYAEQRLKQLQNAQGWQLHLRPTVVYGEYCRPWTDRILSAFREGDLDCADLSGKIQPVYGPDLARFMAHALRDFRPGTLNLAGPEVISWLAFVESFQAIVDKGRLRPCVVAPQSPIPSVAGKAGYWSNFGKLFRAVLRDPSFEELVTPLTRRLPKQFVKRVGDRLLQRDQPKAAPALPRSASFLISDFFRTDRLVATKRFQAAYPEFAFTRLSEATPRLRAYYAYRFTDQWPEWPESAVETPRFSAE